MSILVLPAVCDNCGNAFSSGIALSQGSSFTSQNVTVGPCPHCGTGRGRIADGTHSFAAQIRPIVAAWTPQRRADLVSALEAAKQEPDARAAVQEQLTSDPDLGEIAKRLLVPKESGAFWAMIAVLLTLLNMMAGSAGGGTTINNHTTIINRPTTVVQTWAKPPPPSPRKIQAAKKKAKTGRKKRR